MDAPAPLKRQLVSSGLLLLGPGSRRVMGELVGRRATTLTACLVATAVSVLNVVLIVLTVRG